LIQDFTDKTGINVKFQFLPENDLRQKVTQDVSLNAGNFDIVMVGAYETPIWAKSQWLEPLDPLFEQMSEEDRSAYDLDDLLKPWNSVLSFENQRYSLPFYGESSMLFYRKDLFEEAGIQMPEKPSWEEVTGFAEQLHNPDDGVNGITLRGLPGWGANMASFNTFLNTYGGRWYDMDWRPQLDSPEVKAAIESYANLASNYAQSGIVSDNFPECLNLFSSGKAAMWYDATVAGGLVSDPESSDVADNVGFAYAPTAVTPNGANWLWAWSLGIESASKNKEAAFEFLKWATNKDYINLVGEELGWERVPPGTRRSTYEDTPYGDNPWTDISLDSIETADPENPTKDPVPYTGIQYVGIPEFQQLGDSVGRILSSVIIGDIDAEEMQKRAQKQALDVAKEGQYLKS
jgi:sorbitol/mannitol transport system substrate-binding protein